MIFFVIGLTFSETQMCSYNAVSCGGVLIPIIVDPCLSIYAVISSPKGPAPNSEYEHSSIPATIKTMFNLSSNFLTHRDAWAGTFEQVVGELTSPRTDCPGTSLLNSPLIAKITTQSRSLPVKNPL